MATNDKGRTTHFVQPADQAVPVTKWVVRNRSRNVGYYFFGQESNQLAPGTHVVLLRKPTLITSDLTMVEVKE